MAFPEMLEGDSEDIADTTFYVAENKLPQDGNQILKEGDVNVIYQGNKNLASAWVGWGLLRKIISEGKQAVLLHGKRVRPTYPK